tara:strand:+ start:3283 stop:5628 length:2346 start_codon:yes stop_codon:yes gene_type:complete
MSEHRFVDDENDVPNSHILFGSIPIRINNWSALDNVPIYFKRKISSNGYHRRFSIRNWNTQASDRYVFVDIVQEGNHNATFYNTFRFHRSLSDLLKPSESNDNIFIHVKTIKLIDFDTLLDVNVYIDRNIIETMYTNQLVPTLLWEMISELSYSCFNNIKIKPAILSDEKQPISNCNKIPMFLHQEQNVAWMKTIEKCPPTYSCNIPKIGDLIYNIKSINDTLIYRYPNKLVNSDSLPQVNLKAKGGILTDEVGLGKTYSLIGLIIAHQLNNTLVICPGQICKQWKEEIIKVSNLRATIVANIRQFKKIIELRENNDIIICPYNLLINVRCIQENGGISSYKWDRVIFDEIHECLMNRIKKQREIYTETLKLSKQSKFCWLCSGTISVKNKKLMANAFELIFEKTKPINITECRLNYQSFIKDLIRLNTKSSLSNYISIPPVIWKTKMLKQTPTERIIYTSALGNPDEMVRLCTHVLVSEQCNYILGNKCMTLNEVHHKMLTYYTKKHTRLNRRIEIIKQKQSDNNSNSYDEITLKELKDEIATVEAKLIIFDSLEQKLKEQCCICLEDLEDRVPAISICGHAFCSPCISSMYEHSRQTTIKCPFCRTSLRKNDFNIVRNDNVQLQISPTEKWGTKMAAVVEYLNTTLENDNNRIIVFSQFDTMLRLIADVLTQSNIKFVLIKGSAFHAASKIRKFKLNPDIRVILLSSERASAGTNLTEATHIALIDTFNGEPEYARVIEEQAVGRAARLGQTHSIEATRFVMQDTIEETNFIKTTQIDS